MSATELRALAALGFDELRQASEYGLHVGGASHFALLNHPAVYERLAWLA